MVEKYLQIGKIVNARGVKGELKVIPLTDDALRYEKLDWVYVERNGYLEKYNIDHVRFANPFVLLKLKGIDNIDAAEKLKESFIMIDRQHAIQLPQNSWFICDIIGCSVILEDGSVLGEVTDVLQTGSNDVYVVKNEVKKDVLIPAIKSVVKDVNIESKIIRVSLPEGLIDE